MKNILNKDLIKRISQIMAIFALVLLVGKSDIVKLSSINSEKPESKLQAEDVAIQVEEQKEEEKETIDTFITNNEEQLRFYSNVFSINYDDAVAKLRERNANVDQLNYNNIGLIGDENEIYTYSSVDRGILEYFLYLEKNNPELVNKVYVPCDKDAEYIEALVEYFSSLYPNVDHKLMLSIAAAESGYFTAGGMLAKNNIYGGMGNGGLISYHNIEYGVLMYIKKMSEDYYDKGLNTKESIGYVFCPKVENGVKTVSSHWISLVNKALERYTFDLRYVSVAQLNDLNNNEINEI